MKMLIGQPAVAGEGLADGHIYAVYVRALLLVHLDGDEIPVQNVRRLRVLKALVRHDVAPVAGAVADAQKDGLVLVPGFLKGLAAPGVPVHGIFRVLQEIGAGLAGQVVAHVIASFLQVARRRVVYEFAVLGEAGAVAGQSQLRSTGFHFSAQPRCGQRRVPGVSSEAAASNHVHGQLRPQRGAFG